MSRHIFVQVLLLAAVVTIISCQRHYPENQQDQEGDENRGPPQDGAGQSNSTEGGWVGRRQHRHRGDRRQGGNGTVEAQEEGETGGERRPHFHNRRGHQAPSNRRNGNGTSSEEDISSEEESRPERRPHLQNRRGPQSPCNKHKRGNNTSSEEGDTSAEGGLDGGPIRSQGQPSGRGLHRVRLERRRGGSGGRGHRHPQRRNETTNDEGQDGEELLTREDNNTDNTDDTSNDVTETVIGQDP